MHCDERTERSSARVCLFHVTHRTSAPDVPLVMNSQGQGNLWLLLRSRMNSPDFMSGLATVVADVWFKHADHLIVVTYVVLAAVVVA